MDDFNGSNGWDYTGKTVRGMYLDTWPFEGRVIESRVKYGGKVQHTVVVTDPPLVCGRNTLLVDTDEVTIVH